MVKLRPDEIKSSITNVQGIFLLHSIDAKKIEWIKIRRKTSSERDGKELDFILVAPKKHL